MKRLGYVRRFLLVLTSLMYLVVVIDGYPPSRMHPVYFSDDDYYRYYYDSIDFNNDARTASAANKPALVIGEKFADDGAAGDRSKPSESNIIKLKKKNSEIISALMGLRKAMSSNYGVRQVHN